MPRLPSPSISINCSSPSALQIDRAAFSANVILLFGYTFGLWFQIYEFTNRAREKIAITVYFLGFVLIVISGIIEFTIDICSVRTVGHGRYHSGSPKWNRIISVLFIVMGILDIVGFSLWIKREFESEKKVLLCSAYLLLVMAVLSLFFQMKEEYSKGEGEGTDFIDFIPNGLAFTMDLTSNGFVFIGAVWYVVFLHLEVSASPEKDFGDIPNKMELDMMILFFVSAMLYVIADWIRFKFSDDDDDAGANQSQSQSTL